MRFQWYMLLQLHAIKEIHKKVYNDIIILILNTQQSKLPLEYYIHRQQLILVINST